MPRFEFCGHATGCDSARDERTCMVMRQLANGSAIDEHTFYVGDEDQLAGLERHCNRGSGVVTVDVESRAGRLVRVTGKRRNHGEPSSFDEIAEERSVGARALSDAAERRTGRDVRRKEAAIFAGHANCTGTGALKCGGESFVS
jgi:hypothetical protein